MQNTEVQHFSLATASTVLTQTIEETSFWYTDRNRKRNREETKHGGAEGDGGRTGLCCDEETQQYNRHAHGHTEMKVMRTRRQGRRKMKCYLSGDEDFSEFTDMSGACWPLSGPGTTGDGEIEQKPAFSGFYSSLPISLLCF